MSSGEGVDPSILKALCETPSASIGLVLGLVRGSSALARSREVCSKVRSGTSKNQLVIGVNGLSQRAVD